MLWGDVVDTGIPVIVADFDKAGGAAIPENKFDKIQKVLSNFIGMTGKGRAG